MVVGMRQLMKMIDTVLPPRCPFTGEIVDSQGKVSAEAWKNLSFITDPLCHACGFPFEFAVLSGSIENLCAGCLADRPEFSSARAALVYNDASRDFILGFKHGDQTHGVTAMVPWLRNAGAALFAKADLIVPVPLHRWRLLRRRYNQAALIGKAVAKDAGLRVVTDGLIRTRATPTQGHLNARERRKNVSRAFTVPANRIEKIKGQRVILIDDVYTTGATVRESTKALLRAGAADVCVLTLARVVKSVRID